MKNIYCIFARNEVAESQNLVFVTPNKGICEAMLAGLQQSNEYLPCTQFKMQAIVANVLMSELSDFKK